MSRKKLRRAGEGVTFRAEESDSESVWDFVKRKKQRVKGRDDSAWLENDKFE